MEVASTCTNGGLKYGNACYTFHDTEVNFSAATSACSSADSHLVYIGSAAEEDFLRNHTTPTQDYWIGLTLDGAGDPIWLDNSTLTYDNFAPNSFDEDSSNCFRFAPTKRYEWLDNNCTFTNGFICEKEIEIMNSSPMSTASSPFSMTTSSFTTSLTITPAMSCGSELTFGLAVSFGTVLAVLLVIIVIALCLRIKAKHPENRPPTEMRPNGSAVSNGNERPSLGSQLYETLSGHFDQHDYMDLRRPEDEMIAKQVDAAVPPRNIRFHSQISPIGLQAFGQVWKGEIRGVPGRETKRIYAAIRDLSGIVGVETDMLANVSKLWRLSFHINVVKCLGCCVDQKYIINEYVSNGTLLTYLQTNAGGKSRASYNAYTNVRSIVRRVKEPELLRFAWQIAKGMQFISGQRIVHGNLRASNILITENTVCKIADYGLTSIIPRGKTVNRWMSPEVMTQGACSVESDVWSYGIVLWELVTLGAQPYPTIIDDQLRDKVCSGHRLRRPRHCGEDFFKIMADCWETNPRRRPRFDQLFKTIDRLLEVEGTNDYLSFSSMDAGSEYADIEY